MSHLEWRNPAFAENYLAESTCWADFHFFSHYKYLEKKKKGFCFVRNVHVDLVLWSRTFLLLGFVHISDPHSQPLHFEIQSLEWVLVTSEIIAYYLFPTYCFYLYCYCSCHCHNCYYCCYHHHHYCYCCYYFYYYYNHYYHYCYYFINPLTFFWCSSASTPK